MQILMWIKIRTLPMHTRYAVSGPVSLKVPPDNQVHTVSGQWPMGRCGGVSIESSRVNSMDGCLHVARAM